MDSTFIVDADKFTFPAKYFGTVRVSLDPAQTEFNTLGKGGGHKLMQSHSHNITGGASVTNGHIRVGNNAGSGQISISNSTSTTTYTPYGIENTGGGNAQNLQPYVTSNNIIKV